MKRASYCVIGLSCLVAQHLSVASTIRGSMLELHSCELYAGGCVVSSEATQEGRYLLRVWSFSEGRFANQDLAGLRMAVLELGSQNLAAEGACGEQAVAYLPQAATPDQREALLAWLQANAPDLKHAALQTRVLPIEFREAGTGYAFSAGRFVSVQTVPLESCASGSCGEGLWYRPRMTTSTFAVAVNRASEIQEPWLRLRWIDGGKRSVFLARFGEPGAAKDLYVAGGDFCGVMPGHF